MTDQLKFLEFFAGGGMARAGLGEEWKCLFANDFDAMKGATYCQNWGSGHFVLDDVAKVKLPELGGRPDLVWASFPCQDLSLAGAYKGLGDSQNLTRSGTFWPFWKLVRGLEQCDRKPRSIVLENVVGAITSREGADFTAICNALAEGGYVFGAFVVDARHFVPQSRPRLFFVAVDRDEILSDAFIESSKDTQWHPNALRRAYERLSGKAAENWVWWKLPPAPKRNISLAELIESVPTGCTWHTSSETDRLLKMMSPLHRAKIDEAKAAGKPLVGTIYKRTRSDENGVKRQRAEVRFDGIAGCLRTPGGGSSRQTIVCVDGERIRTRLMSPREAARLMGLDDNYKLPSRYNDAYKVSGDGVCVPVVRFLAANLMEPILQRKKADISRMAA